MFRTLTLALKLVLLKPVVIITSLGSASIPLNSSSKLILTGVGRLATHKNSAVWGRIDGTNVTFSMVGETEGIGGIAAAEHNTKKMVIDISPVLRWNEITSDWLSFKEISTCNFAYDYKIWPYNTFGVRLCQAPEAHPSTFV